MSDMSNIVVNVPEYLASIDDGNGQLKGVISLKGDYENRKTIKFQSVVGTPSSVSMSDMMKSKSNYGLDESDTELYYVRYQGSEYYVGAGSVSKSLNSRFNVKADKFKEQDSKVKVLTAIANMTSSVECIVDVVLNLPFLDYENLKKEVLNEMPGRYIIELFDDGTWVTRIINIRKVVVQPQGMGAVYNHVLSFDAKILDARIAQSPVGVVDMGFGTTNFVYMEPGLNFSIPKSTTEYYGMKEVFTEVQKMFISDSQIKLNKKLVEIPAIVKQGYISLGLRKIQIGNIVNKAVAPNAEAIKSTMVNLWGDLRQLVVVLSGGGGKALDPHMGSVKEQTTVIISEDSEFDNAYGNFKYGVLLKKKGVF